MKSALSLVALLVCCSVLSHAQDNIIFPAGAGVIDVTQPPYNAAGDGVTDDTEAINQAMLDHPDGQFIIYLPEGTYLISDRIDWPRVSPEDTNCGTEQSCRYTTLQGQSIEGTVIKLADGAPLYQDPNNRRAMTWAGLGAAQRFRNAIRNLTLNVGSGNPGAVATQFKASNQGGIFDVKIVSEDGQGRYGIDFSYSDEIGPLLVKNVEIDGFETAVVTNFNVNSMTFENITIRNQSKVGFDIKQQVVNIRGLTSFNEVTAVRTSNQGSHLVLVDSELNGSGDAANQPAIFYGANVFVRNVATPGYRNGITFNLNGTTPFSIVDSTYIEEFVSTDPIRLCNNVERSLNLPIAETPEVPYDDPATWVNIEDFGATNDVVNGRGGDDDTQAIQAALNSGASTVYVPVSSFKNGTYSMGEDVTVPSTVRRIIGTEGRINGPGKFVVSEGGESLIMERFNTLAGGVQHDGPRTLVIKNSFVREYVPGSGADLFLEDVVLGPSVFRNQNVWARQYNVEDRDISITNDNANLWILGLKTERSGTLIKTINGGKTEVLGGHIYSNTASTDEFAFIVEDASLSLAGVRETNFNDDPYPNVIQETRGSVTRTLVAGDANFGINASGFPLFVGYVEEGPNQTPTVSAREDISLLLPADTTVVLSGTTNDDGLPDRECFLALAWEQISGPEATIGSPEEAITTVSLTTSGTYVFRFSGSDGETSAADTVTVYLYDQAITTADGAGADAAIYANSSNNYGAAPQLSVRNDASSAHRKAYIRLDLTQLATPVAEAALALEIATTNTGRIEDWTYNVFGLAEAEDYGEGKLGEDWDEGNQDGAPAEGGLNWFNAPGNAGGGGGNYDPTNSTGGGVDSAQTVFLGTFTTRRSTQEIREFRSAALTQFLNQDTDGLATLIITRVEKTGNLISFAAREDTTFMAPTLKVGYSDEDTSGVSTEEAIGETGTVIHLQPDATTWSTVKLANTYTNPVVVMGPPSYNGTDPTTVRVRNVTSTSFEYQLDEWDYLDGYHVAETISYLVVEAGAHTLTDGSNLVAGIDKVDHQWKEVDLPIAFANVPIVASQCASDNDGQAVVTRQRAVGANGFEVRLQEEKNNDGVHPLEDLHWIASEVGISTSPSYEGVITPDTVNHVFTPIALTQAYSDSLVLLAAMQSFDGSHPAGLRYRRSNSGGLSVRVEEENATGDGTWHQTETVGLLAFGRPGLLYGTTRTDSTTVLSTTSVPAIAPIFRIYPNPSVGSQTTINLTEALRPGTRLQVVNAIDNVVEAELMLSEKTRSIPLRGLRSGTYLIKVFSANRVWTERLLVP